ncbi:MAG: GNAT family N-acetyltransferase [Roseibium sp.]
MSTLPELKTRRLVLRQVGLADATAIADLAGKDFNVARWLTSFTWPYEKGSAEAFLKTVVGTNPMETEAVFAITLDGAFIGVVAIEAPGDLDDLPELPTIGYWLGRAFQGHGYASEAVEAAIEWAFEAFKTDGIAARVYEDNSQSRNLLRKLGFKPFCLIERFAKPLDRRVSNVVVRLDRGDFEMRKEAA